MTSDYLKTIALTYWRFKRGYYLCATEVRAGSDIADVLVSNGKDIIEIEVKISYSDFLADYKKRKHFYNDKIPMSDHYFLKANKFYFLVPGEIGERCLNYLIDNHFPYGLLSFNGKLNILKSCRRLKELKDREIISINDAIIHRATSELVSLREKNLTHPGN